MSVLRVLGIVFVVAVFAAVLAIGILSFPW